MYFSVASAFAADQGDRLSLHQAIQAAWAHDPAQNEVGIKEEGAHKRAHAARSWFAGGPTFDASYYDDRVSGRPYGYRTTQAVISVPLWLPGQGTATERVAQADVQAALADKDVAHMVVAIRVTDAMAAVLLAHRRKDLLVSTVAALQRIDSAIRTARSIGESTDTDVQAVGAEIAQAESDLSLAEEEVEASQSALDILTGQPTPADFSGIDQHWGLFVQASHHQWVDLDDPRVKAVHQATAVAREKEHLAARSFMPNPEVGVGVINQGQYGSPWDTQVGVNVRVPLPSSVTSTPIRTAAQSALAAATTQEIMTRRQVTAEMVRVQAHLRSSMVSVMRTGVAARDMSLRASEMEKSWKSGETPLIEAVRARMDAYNALLMFNRAEINQQVAIIRTVIALGYIP
ncbi:TolC family protein [Swingsia samuiensis]|uniref:TolC family protein n=1 Tax=Swingsia samuiensis TaxID=1293412 RepID=A0A4Y6ULJ2_9PROT|nr:TolC family protein [Swingsia samuiensis]